MAVYPSFTTRSASRAKSAGVVQRKDQPLAYRIGKVNIDEHQELATQFGISSIPTLLLFRKGQVANQIVGLRSKRELKAALERAEKG